LWYPFHRRKASFLEAFGGWFDTLLSSGKAALTEMDGLTKTGFVASGGPQKTMLLNLKNLQCSACDAIFIYAPVSPRETGLPLYCPECGSSSVNTT
jgi:predicted RNA-binding Zn-ribbon protein involved in translation (DUF1610 family)